MRGSVLAQSSAGPYVDRTPGLPPAGAASVPRSFLGHSPSAASQSLLSDVNPPPTPDRVSRFRRDAKFPLGTSILSHRPPPPDLTFGVRTKASESAADLLHGDASRANVQSRLMALREQATYASATREPLGQVPQLGRAPPEALGMTHGLSTNYGESVKSVIYAPSDGRPEPRLVHGGRSIGRMEAGQQRQRGYQWGKATADKEGHVGIDLKSHTFGKAPDGAQETAGDALKGRLPLIPPKARVTDAAAAAMNSSRIGTIVGGGGLPAADGAYRTVVKPRRDLHPGLRTDYEVGVVTNRGTAPDEVLEGRTMGKVMPNDGLSAASLIHSGWSEHQAAPDPTVGRPLRRGPLRRVAPHAGAPVDLAAGVATVRHDKPVPTLRKVTDFTTYGDALAAGSLIAPPKYGGLGVTEMDFLRPHSRGSMRALTESAAFGLSDAEFTFVWDEASSVACG